MDAIDQQPPEGPGAGGTAAFGTRPRTVDARGAEPAPAPGTPAPSDASRESAQDERAARDESGAPDSTEQRSWRRERPISRADVYPEPMVAGRRAPDTAMRRMLNWLRLRMTTELERQENAIEARLAEQRGVSRSNTVAVISPKGGVGKTTTTFVLGDLLASRLKARVVAIDTNPDFGTLAALAPDRLRSERSIVELLAAMSEIETAPQVRPFVSTLPTGLHVLAAPANAEVMREITPERYERLAGFLSRFYDVLVLDLGTGITGPLAQWAIGRADQAVVVTTPEWVTSANVSGALRHVQPDNATLVLNQAAAKTSADREAIEVHFRKQWLERRVTIPYDQQLRTMLDSGTYSLENLGRPTRVPIKQLGLAVAENLA